MFNSVKDHAPKSYKFFGERSRMASYPNTVLCKCPFSLSVGIAYTRSFCAETQLYLQKKKKGRKH